MLRLARPGDGDQLAVVAREAYGKYALLLDEPPAPVLLDYADVASSGLTYVVEEDGVVQGMVTVERNGPHLILRNLAVRPSCQRRGIGTRLTRLVEDIARAEQCSGTLLWTRAEMHENRAFYAGLGYSTTHIERSATTHRVFFYKELRGTG